MYRKDLRRVGLAHGQDSIERISRVRMGERICMAEHGRARRGFVLWRIDGKGSRCG